MESIQKTIDDLSQHFHKTMAEFQQNLHCTIPATSPTSNIAAQFNTFRNFVLLALKSLQGQVEILGQQMDQKETRSRKKILIIHGVPETAKEDVSSTIVNVLKQHLQIPGLSTAAITRCHRMGQSGGDRPRAFLVKFHDLSVRNRIWYGKRNFKGTGITLAEFLTKNRYDTFMAARQHFGLSRCWTKNGQVIVIGDDGKRHSIISKTQLSCVVAVNDSRGMASATTAPVPSTSKSQTGSTQAPRSKRVIRK